MQYRNLAFNFSQKIQMFLDKCAQSQCGEFQTIIHKSYYIQHDLTCTIQHRQTTLTLLNISQVYLKSS
jgi:hypothetical protein